MAGQRFLEGFFATDSRLEETWIRPLVRSLGRPRSVVAGVAQRPGKLVVSFGGLLTPFSDATHFAAMPQAVLSALVQANQSRRQIVSFLPTAAIAILGKDPVLREVDFRPIGHEGFDAELVGAALLITQPGLYGPFEAFCAGIPTALGPPMSFTQMWQALEYNRLQLATEIPLLDEISQGIGLPARTIELDERRWTASLSKWWRATHVSDHRAVISKRLLAWAEAIAAGTLPTLSEMEARRAHTASWEKLPAFSQVFRPPG